MWSLVQCLHYPFEHYITAGQKMLSFLVVFIMSCWYSLVLGWIAISWYFLWHQFRILIQTQIVTSWYDVILRMTQILPLYTVYNAFSSGTQTWRQYFLFTDTCGDIQSCHVLYTWLITHDDKTLFYANLNFMLIN